MKCFLYKKADFNSNIVKPLTKILCFDYENDYGCNILTVKFNVRVTMIVNINNKIVLKAIVLCSLLILNTAEAAQTPVDKLEINGDIRFGYGDFKFKTDQGVGQATEKRHFKQVNTMVEAVYAFDKENRITVGLSDIRVTNAHENDRRAYINRANYASNHKKYGFTLGRMSHYELDDNIVYAYEYYLDGAKLRLGPLNANIEIFGGAIGKGQDRQRGYYIKGFKDWKHWQAKSVLFNFDKAENLTAWNHQKIWSNTLAYKFNDEISLHYERLNFVGQNWGQKSSSQSGYVAGLTWSNLDVAKPNTFFLALNYYQQPQGSFLNYHHNVTAMVDEFDWSGYGGEAMGFKGPGVYLGYTLAKGVLLNFEAYRYKNIYGKANTLKHNAIATYIDVLF